MLLPAGESLRGTIKTFDEHGNPTFYLTDELHFLLEQQPGDRGGSPWRNSADKMYDIVTMPLESAGANSLDLTLDGVSLRPALFVVLPGDVDPDTSTHNLINQEEVDSTDDVTWEVMVYPKVRSGGSTRS